jgi:hypothetical protein
MPILILSKISVESLARLALRPMAPVTSPAVSAIIGMHERTDLKDWEAVPIGVGGRFESFQYILEVEMESHALTDSS